MTARGSREDRMCRFNLILNHDQSAWLNQLAEEIYARTGARVSRSELVRAGIAGLRALHSLAPECPSLFAPLSSCKSGEEMEVMAVMAMRLAAAEREQAHA